MQLAQLTSFASFNLQLFGQHKHIFSAQEAYVEEHTFRPTQLTLTSQES